MHHAEVVIAGTGVAAAASAIWLAELGFDSLLIGTRRRVPEGLEAVPEAALAALPAAVVKRVLEGAAAVVVDGFDDVTYGPPVRTRSSRYIHVNRRFLRTALLAEALGRRARIEQVRTLPSWMARPASISLSDRNNEFVAAIDATGRSACWIGGTLRRGTEVAVMYRTPGSAGQRGRVARFNGGWAYSLATADQGTAAVVSSRGERLLDCELASKLGLHGPLSSLGRRPAFVQWANVAIRGHLLAVGDAAVAYDPIAGHGVRFAFSSALAAANVVSTMLKKPQNTATAQAFYADFVASARDRHIAHVETPSIPPSSRALPEMVLFSGRTGVRGLQMNGLIETGEALLLPDGGQARWIGAFDLLWLRGWAQSSVPTLQIVAAAVTAGLDREAAWTLVRWCLDRGVLRESGPCAQSTA